MPFLRPHEKQRISHDALRMLNSSAGSDVRVEYTTTTGGTTDPVFRDKRGGVVSTTHEDVKAIFVPAGRKTMEQIGELQAGEQIAEFKFDPSVNFAERDNITFWLKDETSGAYGTGTGDGNTWTSDAAEGWTTDEWKGYTLIIGEERFTIAGNGSNTVTIKSTKRELPDSGTFEILSLQPWYPLTSETGTEDGSQYLLGNHRLFTVFVASNSQNRGNV